MKTASLEEHFSEEEIEILDAITITQVRAEIGAELSGIGNPYRKGMHAWVEKNLSSDDPAFMARSLELAAKFDTIDKDRGLHQILIQRVIRRR